MRTRVVGSQSWAVPENRYIWPKNRNPSRYGSASASSGSVRRAAGASRIFPSIAGLQKTRLSSWRAGARSLGSIPLRPSRAPSARACRSCCADSDQRRRTDYRTDGCVASEPSLNPAVGSGKENSQNEKGILESHSERTTTQQTKETGGQAVSKSGAKIFRCYDKENEALTIIFFTCTLPSPTADELSRQGHDLFECLSVSEGSRLRPASGFLTPKRLRWAEQRAEEANRR